MAASVFETVAVRASGSYDVVVGRGLLDETGPRVRAAVPDADDLCLLVCDENVEPLYADRVASSLEETGFAVSVASFPAGEPTKCLESYAQLVALAAALGLSRKSVVVALGGGVIGDLAGFAAATYMRGCHLVQIATSLLAMVDSSVGGKTAVDLPQGKNLVGAFHQPDLVLADLDCLATLPARYMSDGMGEVVKYAVMSDPELFAWLEEPVEGHMERIVARCVSIKRDVVEADEREAGLRKLLNLGHTVGHAIELLGEYRIPHGHAVAAGTAVMARACAAKGWCSAEDAARIEAMLAARGLPCGTRRAVDELCEAALHDKKRVGDHFDIVAVRGVGSSEVRRVSVDEFAELVALGCAGFDGLAAEDAEGPELLVDATESVAPGAPSSVAPCNGGALDPRSPLGTDLVDATVEPGELGGAVEAISSKSAAHRMLICAALADAPTRIRCTTTSQDIEATCGCLRALGAQVVRCGDDIEVVPIPRGDAGAVDARACALDCGESGSTLRFMLPIVCALGVTATLDGHGRLPERPLEPLRTRLAEHGIDVSGEGVWPLGVSGRLGGGEFDLPGDVSSQYVTGLLLALPLTAQGGRVRLHGTVESRPYIDMTIGALRTFGVDVAEYDDFCCGEVDGFEVCERVKVFEVASDARYTSPGSAVVEGDWSNAAFWLCAGALSQHPVTVSGLDLNSVQGDRAVLDVLRSFGAHVDADPAAGSATVCGAGDGLCGCEVDARDVPDLVPVVSVVAACAQGETRIVNAARLRIKESDRLQTTSELLSSLGCEVDELPDGLVIHGRGGLGTAADPRRCLNGARVRSNNDHRIAMAAAIAAGRAAGPVGIHRAQAVSKSYPTFFSDLMYLGAGVCI